MPIGMSLFQVCKSTFKFLIKVWYRSLDAIHMQDDKNITLICDATMATQRRAHTEGELRMKKGDCQNTCSVCQVYSYMQKGVS